jgi:3D (Asp-Asp-Asp) domain-containing protein
MHVRTHRIVRFGGLGLVVAPLIGAMVIAAGSDHQAVAPAAFAAEGEPPPTNLAAVPELKIPSEAAPVSRPVAGAVSPKPDIRVYQGKKYRYVKSLSLRVTAYAPDRRCTHPYDGTTTASGLPVTTNNGRLVASDNAVIPMHWMVVVPGYAGNRAAPVLDRGGAIKGRRLDVMLPTYDQAKSWGVRALEVKIYEPVR